MSLQATSGEWLRWLEAPDFLFFCFSQCFFVFFCFFLFLHCLFNVLDLSVLFLVMHVPPTSVFVDSKGQSTFLEIQRARVLLFSVILFFVFGDSKGQSTFVFCFCVFSKCLALVSWDIQ